MKIAILIFIVTVFVFLFLFAVILKNSIKKENNSTWKEKVFVYASIFIVLSLILWYIWSLFINWTRWELVLLYYILSRCILLVLLFIIWKYIFKDKTITIKVITRTLLIYSTIEIIPAIAGFMFVI